MTERDTYTFLPGDPPMCCPKCGVRTEFTEVPKGEAVVQEHKCPRCGYEFLAEEDEDADGAPAIRPDEEGDDPNADFELVSSAWLRHRNAVLYLQVRGDELVVEALPNSDVTSPPYWIKTVEFDPDPRT